MQVLIFRLQSLIIIIIIRALVLFIVLLWRPRSSSKLSILSFVGCVCHSDPSGACHNNDMTNKAKKYPFRRKFFFLLKLEKEKVWWAIIFFWHILTQVWALTFSFKSFQIVGGIHWTKIVPLKRIIDNHWKYLTSIFSDVKFSTLVHLHRKPNVEN